jgi:group I intron endonuclease
MGIIYRAYIIIDSIEYNYIGQTTKSLDHRKRTHWYSRKNNSKFHNAILKYGWSNFKWEVLEDNINEEDLNSREEYWISFYDSTKLGFNRNKKSGMSSLARHLCGDKNGMYGTHMFAGDNNPMHNKGYLIEGKKNGRYKHGKCIKG